ncbi:MAG: NADH-quinone oxidoreductase subunit L [Bacteroidota bacterium]
MINLSWLIPVLPLLGFIVIGVLNKRISVNLSGIIASAMVLCSFIISCTLFFYVKEDSSVPEYIKMFDWIKTGGVDISFSFLIDRLSVIMLLVITGVGFLIHVYSIGYMHHEPDHSRFFAYLNLFIFFMLILVMGSNYIVMFAGWEGVGLCSYLLIGFWFKNTDYNNAAKKAFIMNRIGDLGFLLGIFLIYTTFGSVSFREVFSAAKGFTTGDATITAITLLLFVGAIGKSAQLPLYTWLPDAMAGPTPVSALIHAATMVTAGIYMIVRSNVLYSLAPFTGEVVAITGLITAVFAATIGLKQNDIKKVLAYSTVSQLGYMFVALGVGAYDTALFHVVTHAFFKALLFLCAGSVIHAMSNEQDIRNMGGLKKQLPITHFTFLIGTLAIAGMPPFAGFFSKDEILAKVHEHSLPMFVLLSLTSVLTAIYMFRLYYLTFHGNFRGSEQQKTHLHESPGVMTIPLLVLAVLSAVGGFIGMPAITGLPHLFSEFMQPLVSFRHHDGEPSEMFEITLMVVSVIALIVIILAVRNYYISKKNVPEGEEVKLAPLTSLIYNKYYIDEIYAAVITRPLDKISSIVYRRVENGFIDKIVNGTGNIVTAASNVFRVVQTGNIGFYIFSMIIGIIALLALNLIL